jgi:hypothetical protein
VGLTALSEEIRQKYEMLQDEANFINSNVSRKLFLIAENGFISIKGTCL